MPPNLSPQDFVQKWKQTELEERSSAQEHFIDLCRLLGHETPAAANPEGARFTFEAGSGEQRRIRDNEAEIAGTEKCRSYRPTPTRSNALIDDIKAKEYLYEEALHPGTRTESAPVGDNIRLAFGCGVV